MCETIMVNCKDDEKLKFQAFVKGEVVESNARKRNLPSWMSARDEENGGSEKPKRPRNHGKSKKDQSSVHLESEKSAVVTGGALEFSKLMEGVVFVLSGFMNPERGILRSQMLEMGAEYQPDWNSGCTLLVCAFSNTPKFRQVKADGGTVISKDWISECYNQRKLVDIEAYLLHAGKRWRRQTICHEARQGMKPSTSNKSLKQEDKVLHSKKTAGVSKMKSCFSPSKVKKWAVEDLKRTISWLENQDEKPEPSEIKQIAAEGILTCLQDVIDAFKQGLGLERITEQWACLPRAVEQLAQLAGNRDNSGLPSKDELCREAMVSKQIYELEFLNMEDNDTVANKRAGHGSKKVGNKKENVAGGNPSSYDSDSTIEMAEEEINQAYNTVASSL